MSRSTFLLYSIQRAEYDLLYTLVVLPTQNLMHISNSAWEYKDIGNQVSNLLMRTLFTEKVTINIIINITLKSKLLSFASISNKSLIVVSYWKWKFDILFLLCIMYTRNEQHAIRRHLPRVTCDLYMRLGKHF